MKRSVLVGWAAVSAAIAVVAGAYGAHGAGGRAAEWLRTGSTYQMAHAVAALALAGRYPRCASVLLGGAALFAGALYLLALGGPPWLAHGAPVGGLLMIGGWIALAVAAFRETRTEERLP